MTVPPIRVLQKTASIRRPREQPTARQTPSANKRTMPRPKTIIVNDPDVLASITAAWREDCGYWAAEAAKASRDHARGGSDGRYDRWVTFCGYKRERDACKYVGIRYDLTRFAGRPLTPSERIRWQESIRRLEAAGRVVRTGNNIMPAPPELLAAQPEAANAD